MEAGSWRLQAASWRLEAGDWTLEAGGASVALGILKQNKTLVFLVDALRAPCYHISPWYRLGKASAIGIALVSPWHRLGNRKGYRLPDRVKEPC